MTTATYPFAKQALDWVNTVVPEDMDVKVSDQELERRWAAARRLMDEQKIDVLVAYGPGHSRWFTDREDLHPLNPRQMCDLVIFPKDEEMTTIAQGAPSDGPSNRRGVKRHISWATGGLAACTQYYEGESAEKALDAYKEGTIGLVGTLAMSYPTVEYLKGHLTKAKFVDVTNDMDEIIAIKSEEEQELCRRSAALGDEALEAVASVLKPGLMLCQAVMVGDLVAYRHGSVLGGMFSANCNPQGEPPTPATRNSTKKIQEGDFFRILIECYGPGGMYTEVGRAFVIGKALPQTKESMAFSLEVQKLTASMLKPGTPGPEIWEAANKFRRENGRNEERRLYCHGQGYGLIEPPMVRYDDPMKIQKGMNITIHPNTSKDGFTGHIWDNFIVGDDGVERIHKFPQELIEIDY